MQKNDAHPLPTLTEWVDVEPRRLALNPHVARGWQWISQAIAGFLLAISRWLERIPFTLARIHMS